MTSHSLIPFEKSDLLLFRKKKRNNSEIILAIIEQGCAMDMKSQNFASYYYSQVQVKYPHEMPVLSFLNCERSSLFFVKQNLGPLS